jgi:small-conductance mechanosensitive channel
VGNFVSGIILMAERSAKIGDFVEIDNTIKGNITDIRMRSVTIKTSANIDIVVPNSDLVQKSFINYTLDEPVRRLSVPFTVAYGVSYETVNALIMKALADSELGYIRDSKEFETEVIMTGMDERGVNYTLFVFVRTYQTSARSSYFRLIYKTLNDNNLPIPAPRLDVSMNEQN